ncbi:5'-3' exonuclease [Tanacetum coccineum]
MTMVDILQGHTLIKIIKPTAAHYPTTACFIQSTKFLPIKPSSTTTSCRSAGGLLLQDNQLIINDDDDDKKQKKKKNERVFFLDVNPICYNGSRPSLESFAHWISLFFSQVSLTDPVIAVSKASLFLSLKITEDMLYSLLIRLVTNSERVPLLGGPENVPLLCNMLWSQRPYEVVMSFTRSEPGLRAPRKIGCNLSGTTHPTQAAVRPTAARKGTAVILNRDPTMIERIPIKIPLDQAPLLQVVAKFLPNLGTTLMQYARRGRLYMDALMLQMPMLYHHDETIPYMLEVAKWLGGMGLLIRQNESGMRFVNSNLLMDAKVSKAFLRVVCVIDGEGAHEYRRQMLPSYKTHRRKFAPWVSASAAKAPVVGSRSHRLISDTLAKCNVPVVKIPAQEADDVVATLVEQVLEKGYRVVIASPDKDFKQLICEDVQLVMPLPELKRWSFYTLDHYIAQYKCDPLSDLSLRCIVGDEADGVPGIQHLVPGFGMKTALKLLKKHGSLQNLLNAAAIRTVGKPYVQDALTKHATHFKRNYEVLSLRRDVNVRLQEDWLQKRCTENDLETISNFINLLGGTRSSHSFIKEDIFVEPTIDKVGTGVQLDSFMFAQFEKMGFICYGIFGFGEWFQTNANCLL